MVDMHGKTDEAGRALKGMLANGPLTAIPKRPQDQDLLALMAAGRFEPGASYREPEVNDILTAWLETFSEPYGIDHVTLRRMMCDSRLLVRTKSGSTYSVNAGKAAEIASVAGLVPAEMLLAVEGGETGVDNRMAADLPYPVILCPDKRVIDGMHRVARCSQAP